MIFCLIFSLNYWISKIVCSGYSQENQINVQILCVKHRLNNNKLNLFLLSPWCKIIPVLSSLYHKAPEMHLYLFDLVNL